MKRITYLTTSVRRCLAAVVLLFIAMLPVTGTSTYYYKVTVNIDPSTPTGIGKVYVDGEVYSDPIQGNGKGVGVSYTNPNIRVDTENDNYQFDRWSFVSNYNNESNDNYSTNPSINPDIYFNGSQSQRTNYTFTAHFTKVSGVVKAKVAQGQSSRGSARVDPTDNDEGDEVTLTATADIINGIRFLGWTKDNGTEYVSTKTTYSFTVDDSKKGTYYAHFSEPQQQIYCRIRNKSGKYLMLYGNSLAETHTRSYRYGGTTYNNIADGFKFTNSLKLVSEDEAMCNPMTVFLRTGESDGIGSSHVSNLSSCGVHYTDLINSHDYPLTMTVTETGFVRIHTTYTCSVNNRDLDLESYLRDDGSMWAVMQTIAETDIEDGLDWEVIVLNEDTEEGSFGAFTKKAFTQGGKYYTTMFTSFPYQLLDGVKAYYLPIHDTNDIYTAETNTAHFKDIPTGNIVPMNTAVVLESDYVYNGSNNRLLPLLNNPSNYDSNSFTNFLQGYNYVYGTINTNYIKNQYVQNNINKPDKFILSQLNGRLGWYYSKADHMTPNKAYMDVSALDEYISTHPEVQQLARTVKFTFGENNDDNEATGIIAHEFSDEVDGPLFDLNGRRVTNGDAYGLKKGVYITNGKKIVVK